MTEHDLIIWLMPACGALTSAIGLLIYGELKEHRKIFQGLNTTVAVHEIRIVKLEENKG